MAGALTADLDHPGEPLECAFEVGNTPQDLPAAHGRTTARGRFAGREGLNGSTSTEVHRLAL